MERKNILDSESLLKMALKYVELDGMSYSEAICEICSEMEIDVEDIVHVITGSLKDRLECEAVDRNLLKSTTGKLF